MSFAVLFAINGEIPQEGGKYDASIHSAETIQEGTRIKVGKWYKKTESDTEAFCIGKVGGRKNIYSAAIRCGISSAKINKNIDPKKYQLETGMQIRFVVENGELIDYVKILDK